MIPNPLAPQAAPPVGLDFAATARRARGMTMAALHWSAADCHAAAVNADALQLAGFRVLKDGGYYRDEASVYRAEIARRGAP